jgi:hypothetical protein
MRMDPHETLGVPADADPDQIAHAYRELAKRLHPDHRPGDAAAARQMAEINAAYQMLRRAGEEYLERRSSRPRPRARRATPGSWLLPEVRDALGHELLGALEPDEEVVVVTDAATWDSPRVRLAVSDRRLLWLRADAPTDRVRFLRWRAVAGVDGRLQRPRRKVGELLVQPRHGRRVVFAEIDPPALRLLLLVIRRHVPARAA